MGKPLTEAQKAAKKEKAKIAAEKKEEKAKVAAEKKAAAAEAKEKSDAAKDPEADKNKKVDDKDPQAPRKDYAKEYKSKTGKKMVKVKGLRNANLIDGSQILPDEVCLITENEYKHICADKRDIKFVELVK